MEKERLELYRDYLISNNGYATATGLSAMLNGKMGHDKVTRFLSARTYTSKDLWRENIGRVETGAKPFDVVLMFKVLVLQQLYNLSEDSVNIRVGIASSWVFRVYNARIGCPMPKRSGCFVNGLRV
jgi:hypothetical protein